MEEDVSILRLDLTLSPSTVYTTVPKAHEPLETDEEAMRIFKLDYVSSPLNGLSKSFKVHEPLNPYVEKDVSIFKLGKFLSPPT